MNTEKKSIEYKILNWENLCQNSEQVKLAINRKYSRDQLFKDSVDGFLSSFNEKYKTNIIFSELCSNDYDNSKIDLEKALMLSRFLEELLEKLSISILIDNDTSLNLEFQVNDVKELVANSLSDNSVNHSQILLWNAIEEYLKELRLTHKNILNVEQFKHALFEQISWLSKIWQREVVEQILENLRSKDKYLDIALIHNWKNKWKFYWDYVILLKFIFWSNYIRNGLTNCISASFQIMRNPKKRAKLPENVLKLLINKLHEDPDSVDWVINLETWELSELNQNDGEWKENSIISLEKMKNNSDILGLNELTLENQRNFLINFYTNIVKKLSSDNQEKCEKISMWDVLSKTLLPIKKEDIMKFREWEKNTNSYQFRDIKSEIRAIENKINNRHKLLIDLKKVLSFDNRLDKMKQTTRNCISKYVIRKNYIEETRDIIRLIISVE